MGDNTNMNPSATKFSMIDAAHSNGKQAVLTADSFASTQNTLGATVHAHTEAIESVQQTVHALEQQVKAMARVMASQNVQKLSETLKVGQEDLRRSLLHQIGEKQKDMMALVEREVQEVVDTKNGLLKKIDTVEAHIMQVMTTKLDEAANLRYTSQQDIDKMKEHLENIPAIADKTSSVIKSFDTRLAELKSEFKTYVNDHEAQFREQDKQKMELHREVSTELEAARDKIAEETKTLSKLIHKREQLLKDEMKEVREIVDKESGRRDDNYKSMHVYVKDEVTKLKNEADGKFVMIDGAIEQKVRPCVAMLREMKRLIDEEATHRDTADKELARKITKEVMDRHHDDERLVSLISTCQDAVNRLHK